ncbi:MAG: PilZ domain-containing protein [Pseudomonadota bacterium]
MAVNQKSKVTADLKRNRLNITIFSTASQKEAQKIYTDIRFCVADLKPGFDIITDYSHCTLAHLSAIPTMLQIMEYLTIHQPGNIIRVVGKTSLIFKQLLRFLNRFQSYKAIYANTLEEAEELLAKNTHSNGLRFYIHGHQVRYSVDQEEETGVLVDISIGGCAVQGATKSLAIDDKISMVIAINHGDDLPLSLPVTARIVRIENELFDAQFLDLQEEQKIQLQKWFAYEIRQNRSLQ